ncbi:MAG: hypothetical protein WAV28_17245 [Sedimentisphaerales bacterium]
MANINKYKIFARPVYRTVTPGAKITYTCEQTYSTYSAMDGPRDKFQWYCYNDRASIKKYGIIPIYKGPSKGFWKDATWTHPGKHTIKCCVNFTDNVKCYYEYPQWVDSVEAVAASLLKETKKEKIPNPYKEYSTVKRYIEVLKDGEKKFPIKDPGKKKKHDERIEELETHRDKLGTRLEDTWGKDTFPIYAAHIEIEGQRRTQLRALIVRMTQPGGEEHWRLVDWTNPTHRSLTGIYDGKADTKEKAIREAIDEWDDHNEYWPGRLVYEVPKRACERIIKGEFATDGKSFWGSVSDFFSYVALGAAVVAGIITLVAPVPGSRVVSGLIWTSIFSSTAAATINIGQRYSRGFSNWSEEAFDGLTIVGNIFGAGWLRYANVSLKSARTGTVVKYALIGQIGTDGVQGVFIAVDHIEKYDAIMNDKTLTPEERTQKLMELFRSLTIDGVMTYISIKGSKKDMSNHKGMISKLDELKDPTKTVDLTPQPKMQGNTKNKKLKVTTQDEQVRQNSGTTRRQAKRQAPKRSVKKALPPKQRGMRARDDQTFTRAAKENGDIILVRNSNAAATQYIGKKGYKPKPMEVKCKTRTRPPNEGLAAVDPGDRNLQEMLQKKGISYEEYKKELSAQGLAVADASEGYIVRDKYGNAFYSDYDLHGIYSGETGKNTYYEAKRQQLNTDLGGDLIQHGPHDLWPDRNNAKVAGPNAGPQPPVTAYMPDGSTVHLETIADMQAFYSQNSIDWKGIYPGYSGASMRATGEGYDQSR